MNQQLREKLLNDRRVIEEINRHLWIESEKAGRNIGFENAREDWLKKFSSTWMEYNMPEALLEQTDPSASSLNAAPAQNAAAEPAVKRRRAKSYIKKI